MTDFYNHHSSSHSEEGPRRRRPPKSWRVFGQAIRPRWLLPLAAIDWLADWAAYLLSLLSLLELLEYCSTLSLLVAVIFYFHDAPERLKLKHYQAWQVINSAQGKGGSGGRIEALAELNADKVSLTGVDVSDAYLQGVDLHNANLHRADLASADMRGANLAGANLELADIVYTNLRDADLTGANLNGADLDNADLTGANLQNLQNWQSASVQGTSVGNVQNPPDGFIAWALQHGATLTDAATRPAPAPPRQ